MALNNTLLDFFIVSLWFISISNATKLLKPRNKPKQNPKKAHLYNIFYDLTTFFKEKPPTSHARTQEGTKRHKATPSLYQQGGKEHQKRKGVCYSSGVW
jgi:hypothetical protein